MTLEAPVSDFSLSSLKFAAGSPAAQQDGIDPAKRIFDIALAVLAMPAIAVLAALLLIANPVFNPGPLFYRQDRMGQGGRRFAMWKFRTMVPSAAVRAFDAPLEEDRIRPLGRLLRRTRLDEVPNFLNVMRGEMSVVGPRPDSWDHAVAFSRIVPLYRERSRVRPGITGLAQVRGGYADSVAATRRKARLDFIYVTRGSIALDGHIVLRTVAVMLFGIGAR